MGLAAMEYRFERTPPTLPEIAGRLAARCGLGVEVTGVKPDAGDLRVRALGTVFEVETRDDLVQVLSGLGHPVFVWAHLGAVLRELGGVSVFGDFTSKVPAWADRRWQELGPWRRFALRYHRVVLSLGVLLGYGLLLLVAPLWMIYALVRGCVGGVRRGLRGTGRVSS